MSLQSELLAKVTAVLNKMNLWETNAKKTEELEAMEEVDASSLVRVSVGGVSKKLELQKLISASISTTENTIISIGEISFLDNDLTIPYCQWLISGVSYMKLSPTVIEVLFAETGKTRIDIVVANTMNELYLVSGFETTGVAVRPNIPINTILVTQLVVTDSVIESIVVPTETTLTSEQLQAIQSSNTPSTSNPFATTNDVQEVADILTSQGLNTLNYSFEAKNTLEDTDILISLAGLEMVKTSWFNVWDNFLKFKAQSLLTTEFLGSAQPTDTPTGTGASYWLVTEPGTYTNFGGVVVGVNSIAVISRDGAGAFTISQTPIDVSTKVNISDIVDSFESTEIDKPASANTARILNEKLNLIADFTPSEVLVSETFAVGVGAWLYESSTFSDWGMLTSAVQNFNKVKIKLRSWNVSLPINNVRLIIREGSRTGTILVSKLLNVNIPYNTIQDVIFDLDETIVNPSNAKLYIQYLTDGRSGMFQNGSTVDAETKYGTLLDTTTEVSAGVLSNRFYVEFSRVDPNATFTQSNNDEIYNDLNARYGVATGVEGGNLAKDSLKSVNILSTSKSSTGNTNVFALETSTFCGFGQILPAVQDFDCVKLKLRSWNASLPVTSVRVVVRETDRNGAIITNQVIPFDGNHLETEDVVVAFANYANPSNLPIWVEYTANNPMGQLVATSNPTIGNTARYRLTSYTGTLFSDSSADLSTNDTTYMELGLKNVLVYPKDEFTEVLKEELAKLEVVSIPDVILPTEIYLTETLESNIFISNAVIPEFGKNVNDFRVDINSAKGAQFNRFWRYTPLASEAGTSSLSLIVKEKRTALLTKTTSLKIASKSAGTGINRKVLIIGDSTVDGSAINTPLKTFFDADVMDITTVGTRGGTGLKHEGRGGWTINDYATFGRTFYRFNVTSLIGLPSISDVYSNNSSQFTVVEINITAGNGYFSCERTSGSNNPILTASTLTKVSGTGVASINYDTAVVQSGNPFWNGTTSLFDFNKYLIDTSQTMAANDWVFIQLGINDMFGQTTLESAETKATTMMSQLTTIMNNIQAVVPNIRIGVMLTIPPAESQDAFASNYGNSYDRELYFKTGNLVWNRKLLTVLDTAANKTAKRYVIAGNLNLDTVNNFPTSTVAVNSRNANTEIRQSNGVHPATSGYAQIADSYISIIKYYL